jgi:hypothetical protein
MTLPYLADMTAKSASRHNHASRRSALRNPRRRRGQWTSFAALLAAGYLLRRAGAGGGR